VINVITVTQNPIHSHRFNLSNLSLCISGFILSTYICAPLRIFFGVTFFWKEFVRFYKKNVQNSSSLLFEFLLIEDISVWCKQNNGHGFIYILWRFPWFICHNVMVAIFSDSLWLSEHLYYLQKIISLVSFTFCWGTVVILQFDWSKKRTNLVY